ncbi:hypothetical protein PENCOP_c015G05178 [Penicillium coprophilum]|uniref:Uncharacterized protein n=1 Tax=Penicillium coprophilum TaxID=36646 RepID=A0A1V6U8X6_9EURO|nr:hypothetical protein PENCOP_c015G05178 [Penicillium coprophilum]
MAPRLLIKICPIPGTGGSMGDAKALKFAQEGAKSIGCDIDTASDAATVEAQLASLAIETYGLIDALYNNAAMAYMSWLDEAKNVYGTAHTVAKGGFTAMTRRLAMEGRNHGLRAKSISQGLIETLQTAPLLVDLDWTANVMQKIMLECSNQPAEISAVASFLASDESSYITAADIRVGGMAA